MDTQSASYSEEKQSGRIGQAQQDFLDIFREFGPLTARQAIEAVEKYKGKRYQQRCGRIAEIENMGFIEKDSVVVDSVTGKRVNTWRWTGRTTPLPIVCKFVECRFCLGKGGEYKSVYVREGNEKQGEMFNETL